MNNHFRAKETKTSYIEARHDTFSSSLSGQAKLQPNRFARLALSFPENCYPGYISSVISAMGHHDASSEQPDLELAYSLIKHYGKNLDINISIEIVRLIRSHADRSWPDDIIDILEYLALQHPHPAANEYSVTSNKDPEARTPHMLDRNSINCVRGCALHAISALLWHHENLADRFKKTMLKAILDFNDAVRFAAVSCVLPYFDLDAAFSIMLFKKLLSSDLRVFTAHGAWDMLYRDYQNDSEFYKEKLMIAVKSDIEELAECASGFICALAIFTKDSYVLSILFQEQFTSKQADRICFQAVSSYNNEQYHELSEKILIHFINTTSDELNGLNRLFYDSRVSVKRDSEFLVHLMQSKQSVRLVYSFLDFLNDSDEDISDYANVLAAIGSNISSAPEGWKRQMVVVDLINCIIGLFDRGKDDPNIRNICLDLWDDLFKGNLQEIKPLADMIDKFE